eukprot:403347-Pyramimonas_sp.AAC.1
MEYCQENMKWVEEKCDDTGVRSTIIVGGDTNSQLGMHRSDSRDLVVSGHSSTKHAAALGPVAKEVENDKGIAIRELCIHSRLSVVRTFIDCGPTYYC